MPPELIADGACHGLAEALTNQILGSIVEVNAAVGVPLEQLDVLCPGDRKGIAQISSEVMNINNNTVNKAYRDLILTGVLTSRRGEGAFVTKTAPTKCRKECRQYVTAHLYEAIGEAQAIGMTKKDITQILNARMASDGGPYSPPPADLL